MWQSLRELGQDFLQAAFPVYGQTTAWEKQNEATLKASSTGMKRALSGLAETVQPMIERYNTSFKKAWVQAVKEAGGSEEKARDRIVDVYLDMYRKGEGDYIRSPLTLSDWFEHAVGAGAKGVALRAAQGILGLINDQIDAGMKDKTRSTNLRFNDVINLRVFAELSSGNAPLRLRALGDWKNQVIRLSKIDSDAACSCIQDLRFSQLGRSDKAAKAAVEAAEDATGILKYRQSQEETDRKYVPQPNRGL